MHSPDSLPLRGWRTRIVADRGIQMIFSTASQLAWKNHALVESTDSLRVVGPSLSSGSSGASPYRSLTLPCDQLCVAMIGFCKTYS